MFFDIVIAGAGIIGLATGMKLLEQFAGLRVAVLDKENSIAAHQTGHNSGVIHSGLYYRPGSAKARLCTSGRDELIRFCLEHGIRHEICGKVVIAARDGQVPALAELFRRGGENGIPGLRMLSPSEVKEFEPHVRCVRGLRVPGTGIVDFTQVAGAYSKVFAGRGGELFLGAEVKKVKELGPKTLRIETGIGRFQSRFFINCAGLHSDRVARLSGMRPRSFPGRILPDKAGAGAPGQKPCLPCAGPRVPLPGRAFYTHDRR